MINTAFIFGVISIAIWSLGMALVYASKAQKGRQTHKVHCETKVASRRSHYN
jgi:hypothetical protein